MFEILEHLPYLFYFSYIFWMGDLNCRLDDTSRNSVLNAIEKNEMEKLLKLDQVCVISHPDL